MRRAMVLIAAPLALWGAAARAADVVGDGGFDDPAHVAWDFENFETVAVSTIEIADADAAGDPGSGSLRLRKAVAASPNSLRAAQCIEVVPGEAYTASASLRIPAASSDEDGAPFFRIEWFDAVGCGGSSLGASDPFFFPPSLTRDAWLAFGPSDASVRLNARSGRLYVGVTAETSPGSPDFFEASWDDVRIVPEPGAALAGSTAVAALSARRRRRRA